MPTLTEDQKRYIVAGLACFRSPQQVADDVEDEFGVKIDRSHVRKYNPQQCETSEKWRVLFDATRKAFVKDTARVGVAHQAYRLDRLQRLADKTRNPRLLLDILRQAAEDVGGKLTNEQRHSGGSTPLLVAGVSAADLTDDQARDVLDKIRAGAVPGAPAD